MKKLGKDSSEKGRPGAGCRSEEDERRAADRAALVFSGARGGGSAWWQ